MQKSVWFSMGLMAGVIVVLLTIIVMQDREPLAYATQAGGFSTGGDLMMRSGGSQPNIQDIIWVLQKKKMPRKPGAEPNDIVANKTDHLILAGYQVMNQGRRMKLVAVRDISFDLDVPEYMNDKPAVRDIVLELKKAQASGNRRKR